MSRIPFQNIGSVVYDLEQQQTLDSLITTAKEHERSSKHSTHYFQLIDDLSLPNIVSNLALSPCNSYLYLGGSYPPQVKIFDLENFSEKVSQHTQNHILSIQPLPVNPPISKFVVLYDSRYVEFFHQHAKHHRIRVPFLARKIIYSPPHCDLYIAGSSPFLFRFNLELGQFLPSIDLQNKQGRKEEIDILCCARNRIHQLLAFGCENGNIKFVDPRNKSVCSTFPAVRYIASSLKRNDISSTTGSSESNHHHYLTSIQEQPISAEEVEYDIDGVTFAVGSDQGQIGLFDLRKNGILYLKSHHHDSEITSIRFTDTKNKYIISSDRYTLKMWRRDQPTFKNVTNIQPRGKINDAVIYPESGMIFVAQDREKVTPYYIPDLGPAPYWCSFLDHFLGSMMGSIANDDDDSGGIRDKDGKFRKTRLYKDLDTKFVSVSEVKKLGMEGLVGTKLLVSDLHGWRMDRKLYDKLVGLRDDGMRTREIQRVIVNEKFEGEMKENRIGGDGRKNKKWKSGSRKGGKRKRGYRNFEDKDEENRGRRKLRKI